MTKLTLGEVSLTRVIEIGRSSFPTTSMLPASTAEGVARHHGWLKPDFWDEHTDDLGSRIGSWIVRTPEHVVLIDTGVGNDKPRASNPIWHLRRGTFLDDLAAAGVTPEQVDVVVITHMHVDHVGWNTRLVDGAWVPTFPNARYVFPGEEWCRSWPPVRRRSSTTRTRSIAGFASSRRSATHRATSRCG
jgi:glyoxylase-like metal-dependent hydrolase (beta-lactamase superfamily II)